MSIAYIHLSDIHFGQERGGTVIVHDDVKERLIDDVARVVRQLPQQRAKGIIISGDIAYAGKADEYQKAARWLDQLAAAAGCPITAIQMVPGNHDIDRDQITYLTRRALEDIAASGEAQLDAVLEAAVDREMFYARFDEYRSFAAAYGCPLDSGGGHAGDRVVELEPNRLLRFIGLNTALTCGALRDEYGRLLLGARQRVIPVRRGEEIVLVAHHPLAWLQDSDDAARYVRNRARVLITGHEHAPSARVENVKEGCELLTLAAGAAVPPHANDTYTYTYNLLQFALDEASDGLQITVSARVWSDDDKMFRANGEALGDEHRTFRLGCPNFRETDSSQLPEPKEHSASAAVGGGEIPLTVGQATTEHGGGEEVDDRFAMLRLRFFRDLSPAKRIAVLVKLGKLPEDWSETLTHPIELRVLEGLRSSDQLDELEKALNEVQDAQ